MKTKKENGYVQKLEGPSGQLEVRDRSPYSKLTFYILTDQLVRCVVISDENASLEDLVGSNFPL